MRSGTLRERCRRGLLVARRRLLWLWARLQRDWRTLRQVDFAGLDVNKAGGWPSEVRRAAIALTFMASFVLGLLLLIGPQANQRADAEQAQSMLLDRYARLAFQAAHLNTYRQQMAELSGSLTTLLEQLPSDAEVPALLEEITVLANGSGLAVESLSLQDERAGEFYTELPIALNVAGGFHDFGHFIAGLAGLPRIVTLHDFTLVSATNGVLILSVDAVTYRYQRNTTVPVTP